MTLSSQANEDFREHKPFDEALEQFLEGKERILTKQILKWMCVHPRDSRQANQSAKDIRYAMTRLGWESKTVRVGEERGKGYTKTDFVTGVTGNVTDTGDKSNAPIDSSFSDSQKNVTGVTGNSNIDFERKELSTFNGGCTPCELKDVMLKVREGINESLSTPSFLKEKDIFSHFSDPDAVEAHLTTLVKEGKIKRKRGRIYSNVSVIPQKGDPIEIVDGEYKGFYGTVDSVDYPMLNIHLPQRGNVYLSIEVVQNKQWK